MKKTIGSVLLAILTGCGGGGGGSSPPTPAVAVTPPVVTPPVLDTADKASCAHMDANAPITLASFNASTNDWGVYGKSLPYTFTNCISVHNVTTDSVAGAFNWSLPTVNTAGVDENIKSYLELIYGHQLNGAKSANSVLPLSASAIPVTFTVNYDVVVSSDGVDQTFFDVTYTSGKSNNTLTTDTAVMVKVSPFTSMPGFVETATIDGVQYDVYRNPTLTAPRYSIFFMIKQDKLSGVFKLKPFNDYLIAKGYLNANDYMDGIEFGTEVVSGTGKTEIKSYSITK